jgi:hypothetical protein
LATSFVYVDSLVVFFKFDIAILYDVFAAKLLLRVVCRWETVADRLKPSERPVVLNRASSTNTTNPFGSTFCYGYQDIIFEVSEGHAST